ncbi:MAG: RnfH family protein, partial [Steroidobacteraceae bacterium]|nr:RnfH family protein [Steroidobacteraceae bacterium]MDW8259927.1 RnfH family protein [Gammaproteobacteria bacterium]
ADALARARQQSDAADLDIDWERSTVGVFGVVCGRDRPLEPGDRIEIYRPLKVDPKDARRTRAAQARRTTR